MLIDETNLNSQDYLAKVDQSAMLECVASSGAQVRQALDLINRDALAQISQDGKPRGLLVAGMGGSGVSGDVLSAVAGEGTPVPILIERTHDLPGWVSPIDLVIAVSCSGTTEETLSVAQQASRRGARLVTIGANNSPLAAISEQTAGAVHIGIDAQGRMPRASLWTIATPLLLVANALELTNISEDEFNRAADLMDALSVSCGPQVEVFENPAKLLGVALAESLPMVWGTGAIGRSAAGRFMAQLAENAKLPAAYGALPEVGHNQIVTFDGALAGQASLADIFTDPHIDGSPRNLHLVLLRDSTEHEAIARRIDLVTEITAKRSIPITEIVAQGEHRLSRIASLILPTDWASVYAAIAMGIDPSPIEPINELKAGLQ
ncbi:MAG: SIS domain-containing protein [Actinobacteria bacterium]|nr:SIS domain-containing protein [Actinomycetota bacterium]NBY15409.1 SIS domain-containing protein [Actinomycetota bacterium]